MNRRTMLKGSLAVAATTPAVLAVAADPIVGAIKAYRDGSKAFDAINSLDFPALGGEDHVIMTTYGAPLTVLDNWSSPCSTKDGAIEAMRFALEEAEDFYCEPSVKAMMTAVLGYLERASA